MKEKLVVGIIANTTNPRTVGRLLEDLSILAAIDTGFSWMDVVLLENPLGDAEKFVPPVMGRNVAVHCIDRATQVADAARGLFGTLRMSAGRLPISSARTMVQRYASIFADTERACVWILDEDLRLQPFLAAMREGNARLSDHVRHLRNERIDVAIGPVFGAPPLPARSSVRTNLEDVVRHLHMFEQLEPHAPWPDRTAENARVRAALPEYYYDFATAHEDPGRVPYWMEPLHPGETVQSVYVRLVEGLAGLIEGLPITRAIPFDVENVTPFALARGGNTIFVNPGFLAKIPNLVPFFDGRACRRSDMIWARLAVQMERARFGRFPIAVWQDRTGPGGSSFGADKLLDDARGSALVRAFDALIAEKLFTSRQSVTAAVAKHGARLFSAHLAERLGIIARSEERVCMLLAEIREYASSELRRGPWANHCPEIIQSVETLHAAMTHDRTSADVSSDAAVVERYFLGLHDDVRAYNVPSDVRLAGS